MVDNQNHQLRQTDASVKTLKSSFRLLQYNPFTYLRKIN